MLNHWAGYVSPDPEPEPEPVPAPAAPEPVPLQGLPAPVPGPVQDPPTPASHKITCPVLHNQRHVQRIILKIEGLFRS